jgi:hypothetical protein
MSSSKSARLREVYDRYSGRQNHRICFVSFRVGNRRERGRK